MAAVTQCPGRGMKSNSILDLTPKCCLPSPCTVCVHLCFMSHRRDPGDLFPGNLGVHQWSRLDFD